MTTSSEDVLLQMAGVRYKKGDGHLYVMNERIAWMAENRDKVAVSHRYQDIKMQKISPEGKPKIQLQVVLHDGNSTTFHFVNRNGTASQIQDRDKVKDLLQQLLPNFKRKVDKDLEEKNRILSENPHLLQLYKDLVITQVLTSEEFWNTHAKKHTKQNNSAKQDIGVSGAFLADIKPQTDGCNGLKYNLTADIIESIFKTYPAVKRKHQENVPSKLTESDFWTKFFQSHYFHRDRITAGTKDIFTECGKIDDQTLKAAVAKNTGDVLFDLRTFEDNALEEGFGGAPSDKNGVNSGNIVHQNMVKRFNQHSMMVLSTCTNGLIENGTSADVSPAMNLNKDVIQNGDEHLEKTNGLIDKHGKKNNNVNNNNIKITVNNVLTRESEEDTEPKNKRPRILEKIHYEDLDGDIEEPKNNSLHLVKVERYLHGPIPILNSNDMATTSLPTLATTPTEPMYDLETTQCHVYQETDTWNTRTPHKVLVSCTAAVNALGELSPGGALMRGLQDHSLAQLVPAEIEKDLRNLYLALSELLQHFWRCFPPTTPEMEAKAIRLHETIQRFQMAKVKSFEERAMRELSPWGSSLTKHLNQLMQTAARKFATWQERKFRQNR